MHIEKIIGNTNENLVNGSKIIWKNFRKIIIELANNEKELICQEYIKRDKQSNNIIKKYENR